MLHRLYLCSFLAAALMSGCDQSPPPSELAAQSGATADSKSEETTGDSDSEGAKATPEAGAIATPLGAPVLGLARLEHDFGEIWDLEEQQTVFNFENKGEGPLIIEEVKASCGCTTPTLDKKTYLPGEAGTLQIAFAPKGNGRQTKTLTVRCNDPKNPVTVLRISSTIKPFVKPDPLYLRYQEVAKGESMTVSSSFLGMPRGSTSHELTWRSLSLRSGAVCL